MHRLLPNLLLAALSGVLGCAGSEPDTPAGDSAYEAASEAIAVVSLTWRASDPSGLAQVYVIDHAPGQRPAALELLSLPAAALVLDTSLGVDECRVEGPRGEPGPVGLRDAGEIAVLGEMGVSVLDSRWMPEGSFDVSGVAYSGLIAPQARSLHRGMQVVADGSAEVGPFTVMLTTPRDVRLLSVGGHEVVRGRVPLAADDLSQHLDVVWEPPDAPALDTGRVGAGSAELTAVVFERRTFGATWTISCVAEDDGRFTIPAAALLALPDLGADRTDSVIVRRISSASFSARHLPDGMALSVSEDQAYVE